MPPHRRLQRPGRPERHRARDRAEGAGRAARATARACTVFGPPACSSAPPPPPACRRCCPSWTCAPPAPERPPRASGESTRRPAPAPSRAATAAIRPAARASSTRWSPARTTRPRSARPASLQRLPVAGGARLRPAGRQRVPAAGGRRPAHRARHAARERGDRAGAHHAGAGRRRHAGRRARLRMLGMPAQPGSRCSASTRMRPKARCSAPRTSSAWCPPRALRAAGPRRHRPAGADVLLADRRTTCTWPCCTTRATSPSSCWRRRRQRAQSIGADVLLGSSGPRQRDGHRGQGHRRPDALLRSLRLLPASG
jgi:hypothetical protein